MFTCAVTKRSSLSGEKPTKLVVESRPRSYVFHDHGKECRLPHEGDSGAQRRCYEEVSRVIQGAEIVKEILVSAEGMKLLEQIAARESQA